MRWLLSQLLLVPMLLSSSIGAAFAQTFDPLLDSEGVFPTGPVKKLGDGELTCAQLYTEVQDLETTIRDRQTQYEALMDKVSRRSRAMTSSAGGIGGASSAISTLSGLAGLIPGAGLITSTVGSLASSAAQAAEFSALEAQIAELETSQGELMKLGGELGTATARREHLTDLFLKKDCKVSELQTPASQPAPSKPSRLNPRQP